MEVSGRANGISFSGSDDREQDEVIRLKHSCRALGRRIEELLMRFTAHRYYLPKSDIIHLYTITLVPQF
jgi:predicted enzyme involved in methoxymalonyl-ACP biosynthesis